MTLPRLARLAPLAVLLLATTANAATYDLVLRNGRVVDGAGNPAFFADVAVENGRIVRVGRVRGKGRREIDARGLIVAPGFIDVHTHIEDLASQPGAENFARMGVTTLVTGNCGASALDVGKALRQWERTGIAMNVATLIGHNTVRGAAMGGSFDRPPTEAELTNMRELVARAMREGAVGMSTGLIYLPGTFAKAEEIIALAKVAAAHDGIYASHMRDESLEIFSALDELFRIAREAGIRAQVSHIKLGGDAAWGRADAVLAAIEQARSQGLDVTQDQYVYTAASTSLGTLIPASAREGGRERFLARLDDPAERAKIVAQMKETLRRRGRGDYGYAVIARYERDPSLNGKSVVEAARLLRGSQALDEQIALILEIERNGGAKALFHGIHEDDLQRFLRHPHTMLASDGVLCRDDGSVPHPRSYGNNPRLLARYVRELKLLRLEDAVRKMTSLPATTFRLRDRGLIREGCWADLVLFDTETVQDTATFREPHRYPAGIRHVLVNGVVVVEDGRQTDARPGKALRHRVRR